MKKNILIGFFIVFVACLASCSLISVDNKNDEPTTHTAIHVPVEDNAYTETVKSVPKNDYEHYENKISQMFNDRDSNFHSYNVIRGCLDIKSIENNYFSANFLNGELQSYELTIFGEMGKSEYNFFIKEGFIFLHYILTEYTAPFVTNDTKEYATRFIAENDELLIYNYINEKIILSALTNDEQQRIFNNALDFEQRILNSEFQKKNWVDTFTNLMEYGNIYGNFHKIILIDIDFDSIPELFLTMSSVTGGDRHWIDQGFAYKDGMVVDIKCSLPINLELYRDKEKNELLWIASGVDYNFFSNPVSEHSYDHYWIRADFSDISKTEWLNIFHWKEEYTTIWDVDDSQSESIFTLVGYFDDDRIMSKTEIDELHEKVFSRYEHIDSVRVIGDAQKYHLIIYTTVGDKFLRDELIEFLRSYKELVK